MEWENVVAGQRADPAQINKIGNQVAKYKGLRLARRIVLTEAVSSITFDTDDDGKPLDSKLGGELVAVVKRPGASNNITLYARLNSKTTSSFYWNTSYIAPTFIILGYIAVIGFVKCSIISTMAGLIYDTVFAYNSATSVSSAAMYGGTRVAVDTIDTIQVYVPEGVLPIGTVIEWWERG